MNVVYPWSAVVGQDTLKQALLLCAIDPTIGGVLVQGQRGVAKTTLARALGELVHGPFVELPLGASEERVSGTLDLNAALQERRVQFSPGLLARAHEGVLYVDEVNLLADPLVDLLLDAAASGQNTVERDGISHAHAARFVLVGTMNPDEGELRPQLTDRFGLSVLADGQIAPAQRTEIVTRRLSFEADRAGFVAAHAAQQAALSQRIAAARSLAPTLHLNDEVLQYVAQLCFAAGVEGVRADLAMLRAARAHAAWHARTTIERADVDAVSELALAHRRKASSPPPSPRGPQNSPTSGNTPNASGGHDAGTRGALQAVPVRATPVHNVPSWLSDARGSRSEPRRRGRARVSAARGLRARRSSSAGSVDWFATLAQPRGMARLTRDDLRFCARRTPARQLWVLALDCSSSMLRAGGLSAAKGFAQALQARAHRVGAHLTLISFRGERAQLEAGAVSARSTLERSIGNLVGGGGTPLLEALHEAFAACDQRSFRARDVPKQIVLVTDARTREAPEALAALARAHILREDLSLVLVDCERGPVRLGRAAGLAAQLGARCVHVDTLM